MFLLSDGKLNGQPQTPPARQLTLGELLTLYQETLTEGAKAATTLATERTHVKHLRAALKPTTPMDALTKAVIQAYADARTRKAKPVTVKKEVATLGFIWRWGVERGHVLTPPPSLTLTYRKQAEKEPFRTWEEIEAILAAGHVTPAHEEELWGSLYLSESQIREILEHVRATSPHTFMLPMVAFAAYTGVRRSELVVSQRSDFDLAAGQVLIREKKRKQTRGGSYRHVPLHPALIEILTAWFAIHPGGTLTFCRHPGVCFTWNSARKYLRRALDGSQWAKIGGWHTFRHSFASNCARRGVPQAHIDSWMGHQTEVMRERYRHLFPHDQRQSIARLFPEGS